MRTAGIILLILGIIGLAFFGIQAINASETASVLGVEVAVSDANWTPVISSAVVTVLGIIFLLVGKKK